MSEQSRLREQSAHGWPEDMYEKGERVPLHIQRQRLDLGADRPGRGIVTHGGTIAKVRLGTRRAFVMAALANAGRAWKPN